jgi:methionine synthase II (cobalamin-independent)
MDKMTRPIDVGSFPLDADLSRYLSGATDMEENGGRIETSDAEYFVSCHNAAFKEKLLALGPENAVASYAQCRGMIDQFLLPIVRHVAGGHETRESTVSSFGGISLDEAQSVAASIAIGADSPPTTKLNLAEVFALQRDAKSICSDLGIDRLSYKACITGPLELTLNLQRLAHFPRAYNERLVEYFTEVVKTYVKSSIQRSEHLQPAVITMDEPAFGLEGFGDFFSDSSADSNLEHLLHCWNEIYRCVPSDCYRGIHLHASPFEYAFHADWNLLEAHVGVYVKRQWLEDYDKFIRAAIVRTDGPTIDGDADIKAAWQEIISGNYKNYLQSCGEMEKHLHDSIDRYGAKRVPFAGPECGFGTWDWKYGPLMAIETLERMNQVIKQTNMK